MMYSKLIAHMFGLYFMIMSVGMLFKPSTLAINLRAMSQHPAALVVGSFFPLILGVVLVISHNYWVWDWRVVITVLSWLCLIKGILLFWWPNAARVFYKPILLGKSPVMRLRLLAVGFLFLGSFLLYQ